jgi:hypothetical protein
MKENVICTAEIAVCAGGLATVEMGVGIIAALPTGCEMTDGRLGERLIEPFTPTQ